MKERTKLNTNTKWEKFVGYSRAVRVDKTIEITGTVAINEQGETVGMDDPYRQTQYILHKIENILKQLGSNLGDVVRTRMFVTDISRWKEIGRAHGEVFRDIKPCTTMVEVSALIDPKFLIEIEATAIVD